mmetsp:Transcript_4922/g.4699  ORF Transcript_4922/g.4699 Transcript_4922/m.4699 type:complete len:129 (+) Transcript_4922:239-625(+)
MQIKNRNDLKEKIFIATINFSENRNLENHDFVGPYPKIYYFTYFENMRKREYKFITSPYKMMTFLKGLEPQEPELYLPEYDLRNISRHNYETHLILGLFPDGKDEIYNTQYIEVANKYSHLGFYACFE